MELLTPRSTKTYIVKNCEGKISITGKGDDPHWNDAHGLTDFSCPWENTDPYSTSFRALHNDQWLYCKFEAVDPHVRILTRTNQKAEVISSDRVEIFFRTNATMSPYYCLEIDPLARVFDCKGEFYRKLDTAWRWPQEHLTVRSSQNEGGYVVELAISKQSLKELGLLKGNRIECGLFRADCTSLDSQEAAFRWISWMKPESSEPDFHIPSAFGLLILD